MKIEAANLNLNYESTPRQGTEHLRDIRPPKTEKPLPEKRVEQSEDFVKLKNALEKHDIALRFSRDGETNELVVQMIDEKSGEEIRQIPTKVSLSLAAEFVRMQGQFVDEIE